MLGDNLELPTKTSIMIYILSLKFSADSCLPLSHTYGKDLASAIGLGFIKLIVGEQGKEAVIGILFNGNRKHILKVITKASLK